MTKNKRKKLKKMISSVGFGRIAFLFSVVAILAIELTLDRFLFQLIPYTNSSHIDYQLKNLQKRSDWTVIAIGSSETRYGFDPEAFESTYRELGKKAPLSFNYGIDGFNTNYYFPLLPYLGFGEGPLKNVKTVLIGVSLTEPRELLPASAQEGFDCSKLGILQRTVFTSSFAKDRGMDIFCQKRDVLSGLRQGLESASSLIRYRKSIRHVLVGSDNTIDVSELLQTDKGHHYRRGMETQKNYDFEFNRWIKEHNNEPEKPLDESRWLASLKNDGIYEQMLEFFESKGIRVVFFALPTNPDMLKLQGRFEVYNKMGSEFARWANKKGVTFIDLGIKTNYDILLDYADRRHLSQSGAKKFTKELALALIQRGQ